MVVILLSYIKKICPACGNEFVVLKNAEDKAVYCTLACLLGAQDRVKENEIASSLSV